LSFATVIVTASEHFVSYVKFMPMPGTLGAALAAALRHIPPNRSARRTKKLETPVSAATVGTMSIAELKHFADKPSAKERT
jgi:hypothetical protein